MQTVTPLDPAATALRETSSDKLLTTIEALTHRIHECKGSTRAGVCDGPCTSLREQRGMVRAEVLRRITAGAR